MEIVQAIDAARIRDLRERGEFFWLEHFDPSDSDLNELSGLVTIDPLALEDSREFGQLPKLDDYEPPVSLRAGWPGAGWQG